MARLHEKRTITGCPYSRAKRYLHEILEPERLKGTPDLLKLSVPAPGGEISKEVLVSYRHGADPMHFDELWKVWWTPEGGGPYPDFEGMLLVRSDEDYRNSIVEIRGEYNPPLGLAGQLFDAMLGWRIASAMARELLDRIAERFVKRDQAEVASKTIARS